MVMRTTAKELNFFLQLELLVNSLSQRFQLSPNEAQALWQRLLPMADKISQLSINLDTLNKLGQ